MFSLVHVTVAASLLQELEKDPDELEAGAVSIVPPERTRSTSIEDLVA
jgi:hypothetical protein